MRAPPQPPPAEATLIRARREAPPKMSMRSAARSAGISESRWRQIEAGGSWYRGRWEPETAPAATLARMARAVGVTAAELESCRRGDAAGELTALMAAQPERELTEAEMWRDLSERIRRIEDQLGAQETSKRLNGDEGNGTTSRAV